MIYLYADYYLAICLSRSALIITTYYQAVAMAPTQRVVGGETERDDEERLFS